MSHIGVPVQAPAPLLSTQIFVNLPWTVVKDSPSTWASGTHNGNPDGDPDS